MPEKKQTSSQPRHVEVLPPQHSRMPATSSQFYISFLSCKALLPGCKIPGGPLFTHVACSGGMDRGVKGWMVDRWAEGQALSRRASLVFLLASGPWVCAAPCPVFSPDLRPGQAGAGRRRRGGASRDAGCDPAPAEPEVSGRWEQRARREPGGHAPTGCSDGGGGAATIIHRCPQSPCWIPGTWIDFCELPFPAGEMWKASAGHAVSIPQDEGGADDWETDPDFVNDVSEKEQRWGAKTVQGSGHQEHINIHKLRENVFQEHQTLKEKELETGPKASHGYGGKFGVEQDRMDKSAVGHEYQSKLSKHCSQVDSVRGFGGKFGVQMDRVDQSAVGFEYQGKTEKHASQKDYSSGFGGKYGVQADRVDKSAVGFDYQGKTEKHESQQDYSRGFGGKYGIDKDKVDKSAVGFEYQGKTEKHESQKDYVKGFGGKFGVQTDRQDKCALGWDHQEKLQLHESQRDYKTGFGGKFGVQSERQDSSAVGFDYKERLAKHESQQDYSKGFGGKFGVQKDRMDKNASTFEDVAQVTSAYQKTVPIEAATSKTSNIRANFENLAKEREQEDRRKAEAERAQRMAKERQEQEEARRELEEQARTMKQTPPASPSPQPAEERLPSSPVYEDAAPLKAEPSYRGPSDASEPESVYSTEAAGVPEAASQQGLAYASEPVYETTDIPGHYQAGEDTYDEFDSDLGITAIALYDYQAAGDDEISFDPDDIITNIEMIDDGWWRGVCKGRYGLFPANYVELRQ